MVTAIVLLNTERNNINEIAQKLADMQGVSEVYSIAGKYDLALIVRVKNNEDLANLVTDKFLKIKGIEKSETLIAFKAFSKHDLERMFSIGLEK